MKVKAEQKGAALMVALIFLVVMTIAGITAMRFSSLEEKITGNVLIKNHNFQVAHSEIRAQLANINTGAVAAVDNLQQALNQPKPTDDEKAADVTSEMLPSTALKNLALTKRVTNSTSNINSSIRFLNTSLCEGADAEKFTCYTFELNSTASAGNSRSWQSQGFNHALNQ